MADHFNDGNWTTGFETGANLITYPFARWPVPDTYARTIHRSFSILPANFTPLLAQRTTYTNYLLQSETFGTTWSANAVTVSSNVLANPMDGTVTADQFLETSATAEHSVSQAYTFTAVSTVLSCFVKANSRTWVRLKANDGTTNFTAFFNLSTGVASAGTNCTSSIYDAGNGWYRCIIIFTPAAAAGNVYLNASTDGSTVSYAGNTADGLYLWGAQLERSASVGPYVVTTTASASISAPQNDTANSATGDIFAYLVDESDLAISELARAKFTRTYSRIPSQKTVPSSIIVSKPDIPTTGFEIIPYMTTAAAQSVAGKCWLLTGIFSFQRDISQPSWELYRPISVTTDSSNSVSSTVTGGTYTLTFGANTTSALNWNDAAGTVETALNALSSISALGGVTVTGSYSAGFVVTFAAYSSATLGLGSLTGSATLSASVVTSEQGYVQNVTIGSTITGGTYTVTILGQTTAAINYNASIAAISSAINALSNVTAAGGATISGTGLVSGVINFTILFRNSAITGSAATLQPAGSIVVVLANNPNSASAQGITLRTSTQRILSCPSHGIQSNDTLAVIGSQAVGYTLPQYAYFDITSFTVLDANTIAINSSSSSLVFALPFIIYVCPLRVTGYQPAPINVRCSNITDYYLPGVSTGITTANDIPQPVPQSDPVKFLAGCVTASTLNYEVGNMESYIGPILQNTKRVVNVADLGVTTINLT